jgi:hypothetical protein
VPASATACHAPDSKGVAIFLLFAIYLSARNETVPVNLAAKKGGQRKTAGQDECHPNGFSH